VGSEPPPTAGCNITVNGIKIKLEAIILLDVADLIQKNVSICHCETEPLDVFFTSWHEFECCMTVQGGLLYGLYIGAQVLGMPGISLIAE
jgi:hypothetical protein